MNMKQRLITAAEKLFDEHGFTATGMDQLTEAACMSSRTLYKHAGSKVKLMALILTERDRRFLRRIEVGSVDALFAALEDWNRVEGTRGCLFLRARAETGGEIPEISEAVAAHKSTFHKRIADIVLAELGYDDPILAEQVLVLFEGAIHAAVYRGAFSVSAARAAASVLVENARS